jgi:hypothetical protein
MEVLVEQTLVTPILEEFRTEVATTKRVLERVPAEKLAWKPHVNRCHSGNWLGT